MDFEDLREYLADNIELKGTLNKKEIDAIFLLYKPQQAEADNFIVYSFYELDGGKTVRHFMLELKLCCADVPTAIALKDSIVNLLDFYNRPCEITRFKKFVFSNEGGIYFDENTGYYVDKLFFDCKLI